MAWPSIVSVVDSDIAEGDEPAERVDGRRARRERNREAVIEAMFSLVRDGKFPPTAEDVAARAEVSVSSVFRNFEGLADLQRHALDLFEPKFSHLFVVDDAQADRGERIRSHVHARVDLIQQAGGLLRVARARALDHDVMIEGVANLRQRFAAQTRQRFARELQLTAPAEAANLIAVIDATTSPEAFEVMSAAHARSLDQISATWTAALEAVLSRWIGVPTAVEVDDSNDEENRP